MDDGARSRRPRSDLEANRTAIVAAAAGQLRQSGTLTMRTVAADAGVSRSTLYRHFPTRPSLEDALVDEAVREARARVAQTVSGRRPALAALRDVVTALVEVGADHRLHELGGLPLGERGAELVDAALPAAERLRVAAEVAPAPPAAWLAHATAQLVHVCLETGAREREDPRGAGARLFESITDQLDQGLVVLDPDGALLCLNAPAAMLLTPDEAPRPGEPLTEPSVDVLYEDGSPCPPDSYPLTAAVASREREQAVRGHRRGGEEPVWVAVTAIPLRVPGDGDVYGVLGLLTDVTAERRWELERLRPAGQLGRERPVPVDIARILDEIPPHLFPEQFASEARRISGGPVALYVLDIDGTQLLRLAGPDDFPAQIEAPLSLGAEMAEDGMPDLHDRLAEELPGVGVAPMWLRGRAVGLLLALGARDDSLTELARHGAAAMELAGGYTDVFDAARRRKETEAAAELQQSLLPPRIARIGGGEIAGSVMPAYEVGGDWFDYVENRDGVWLAVADAVGKGATAGALGGIALAALRAARRGDASLEEAALKMHEAVFDVSRPEFYVTAVVARWNAVYSTFSWICCGHPPPLVVRPDGTIEQLMVGSSLPLGLWERERRFSRHQRRLEPGERLILHSDGVTARRTAAGLFGVDGIERAVREAGGPSAAAAARAIQEAVLSAAEDKLQDDAVAVVLAPAAPPNGT
jgi:AcrR family transcriptional regulator